MDYPTDVSKLLLYTEIEWSNLLYRLSITKLSHPRPIVRIPFDQYPNQRRQPKYFVEPEYKPKKDGTPRKRTKVYNSYRADVAGYFRSLSKDARQDYVIDRLRTCTGAYLARELGVHISYVSRIKIGER